MGTYGKQIDNGGGSGFSADTPVPVDNSNGVPVTAAELITSLPVNTAGSEIAQFLVKLLNGGIAVNSWALTQAGMAVDPGSVQSTWDLSLRFNGSETARIRADNAGVIRMAPSSVIGGVMFYNGSTAASLGNLLGRWSNGGIQAFSCPIMEAQGPNTTSANNIVLNGTFSNGGSGNAFIITGSTQMNLLDYGAWQNGVRISLRCTGTPIIKHAQAASGTLVPYIFRSGADFQVTAADQMIDLVLMGATSGGTPTGWYCLNH